MPSIEILGNIRTIITICLGLLLGLPGARGQNLRYPEHRKKLDSLQVALDESTGEQLEQIIRISPKLSEDWFATGDTLGSISVGLQGVEAARRMGRLKVALSQIDRLADMTARYVAPDHHVQVDVYGVMGGIYLGMQDWEGAYAAFDTARNRLVRYVGTDNGKYPFYISVLGVVLGELGQYDKAVAEIRKGIELEKSRHDTTTFQLIVFHSNIGSYFRDNAQFDSAEVYIRRAISLARNAPHLAPMAIGPACINLGIIFGEKEQMDSALFYFREAEKHYLETLGPDAPRLDDCYNNQALTLQDAMQWEEAEELFKRAIAHIRRIYGPDDPNLMRAYNNLSVLLMQRGRLRESWFYAYRAMDLRRQTVEPDHPEMISSYVNLSGVYRRLGQMDSSWAYLQKALTWARKPSINREETLSSVARHYRDQEVWDSAGWYSDAALREAISLYGDGTPQVAQKYEALATLAIERGRYGAARENLQQARRQFEAFYGPSFLDATYISERLAHIAYLQNDPDLALSLYQTSLEQNVDQYQGASNGILDWQTYLNAQNGRLQIYLQSFSQQSDSLQKGLRIVETTLGVLRQIREERQIVEDQLQIQRDVHQLVNQGLQMYEKLASLDGSPLEAEASFDLVNAAQAELLIASRQMISAWRSAGASEALLETFQSLIRTRNYLLSRLQKRLTLSEEDQLPVRQKLGQITWELDSVKQELETFSSGAKHINKTQLATLQATQSASDVWVQFFWGRDKVWTWIVRRDSVDILRVPVSNSLLQAVETVKSIRQGPGGPDAVTPEAYAKAAWTVFDLLLGKAWKELGITNDRTPRICIVPDGPLHGVSFEALLWRKPEGQMNDWSLPYLIHKANVRYGFGTENLELSMLEKSGKGYGGWAPSYVDSENDAPTRGVLRNISWQPLPYANAEVQHAAQFWNGNKFLGALATEESFRTEAPSLMILHLAMHAQADEAYPPASGLVFQATKQDSILLEDGMLRAYEIESMRLPAELAVLSACETGAGQVVSGEGVMSLARSFAVAGTQSVITSLWAAEDAATGKIMTKFWEVLASPMERGEALRMAKLHFLAEAFPLQKHPFYWANFVLMGKDGEISSPKPWGGWILGMLGLVVLGGMVWWIRKRRSEG